MPGVYFDIHDLDGVTRTVAVLQPALEVAGVRLDNNTAGAVTETGAEDRDVGRRGRLGAGAVRPWLRILRHSGASGGCGRRRRAGRSGSGYAGGGPGTRGPRRRSRPPAGR